MGSVTGSVDDDPMTDEPTTTPADAVPDDDPTVLGDPNDVDRGPTDPGPADAGAADPLLPPPPVSRPPDAPTTGRTGLVRDPYSRLGGLASGLAHRYGWDPTLVRLVFVAALIASFGTALIVYVIAWLVVPRATVWPPSPVRTPAGGFSSREAGIGLAIAGLLAFLVAGAGAAGAVLVPLALVGGGIWLLTQEPRTLADPSAAAPAGRTSPVPPSAVSQPVVGAPVAPRSRKRRWLLGGLIAAGILTVLAALAIPVAVLGYFASGTDGGQISVGNDDLRVASYAPTDLDSIPTRIIADHGLVRVDLSSVAAGPGKAAGDEPVEMEIELGDGEIWLTLPDDVSYSLDATTDSGRIDTGGADVRRERNGARSVQVEQADADVTITVHTEVGDINVDG